jgi:hypothetical protein
MVPLIDGGPVDLSPFGKKGGDDAGNAAASALDQAKAQQYKDDPLIAQGRAILDKLIGGSLTPQFDRTRKETANTIAEQYQARNLGGSGLHMKSLTDAMGDIGAKETEAQNTLALEVFNALQAPKEAQLNRDFQSEMYTRQVIDAQSARNQDKRANIWGGILNLAGTIAGKGAA